MCLKINSYSHVSFLYLRDLHSFFYFFLFPYHIHLVHSHCFIFCALFIYVFTLTRVYSFPFLIITYLNLLFLPSHPHSSPNSSVNPFHYSLSFLPSTPPFLHTPLFILPYIFPAFSNNLPPPFCPHTLSLISLPLRSTITFPSFPSGTILPSPLLYFPLVSFHSPYVLLTYTHGKKSIAAL